MKIYNDSYETEYEKILYAFYYIYKNIKCDFILFSSGTNYDSIEFENIVQKLCMKKNIYIVSAFDNSGAISYPAAYNCVIGVDSDEYSNFNSTVTFTQETMVNVLVTPRSYRVKGLNMSSNIVKGNSYAAAQLTGMMISCILDKPVSMFSSDEINEIIKIMNISKSQNNSIKDNVSKGACFVSMIKNAIIFSFNKEMHSLSMFYDLLPFQIQSYFDVRQNGFIGKKISEILAYCNNSSIINDYAKIDWQTNFDTVILGHTKEITKLTGVDYLNNIINNCLKYGKKLYSFDRTECQELDKIFYPYIDKKDVLYKNGKLKRSSVPIIGVYGTSSKQGKFTVQLSLRKIFLNRGYKVAQIGSEPSSLLFGFNDVFPFGYNSTVSINGHDSIIVLNKMIIDCEKVSPDIIITGSQSGTVPYDNCNLRYMNLSQSEFILGTQPDLIILVVNYFDEIHYIKRTINFLEGLCECKVIGIVLHPRRRPPIYFSNDYISTDEFNEFKFYIQKNTGIETYRLGSSDDFTKLDDSITQELTEN